MNRRRLVLVAALFLVVSLVTGAYALSLIGSQKLPKPPSVHAAISFSCSTPALVNVTDPDPLLTGQATGNNGTAVFGCGFLNGGVTPALQVTRAGTVSSSFTLPAGVSLYLVPNTGSVGPLAQFDCAEIGILITPATGVQLPLGGYSYCETFVDSGQLVDVTATWYQG